MLKSPALAEPMKPLDRLVASALEAFEVHTASYGVASTVAEADETACLEVLKMSLKNPAPRCDNDARERKFAMPHENSRDEQLNLLTPQQLAKLIEPRLSPTRLQEEEMASRAGRGVREVPCSGGGMIQKRLPGIDWSKLERFSGDVVGRPDLARRRFKRAATQHGN